MKEAEPDIVEAVLSGDKKAYERMYMFYYNRLYNYGRKITSDTGLIEDAIQESFIALWKSKSTIQDIRSPKSYLFTVFRNRLTNDILREQKFSKVQQDNPDQLETSFPVEYMIIHAEQDAELKQKLEQSLAKLTERQREIIFLRFYENISYEEAAVILDITTKGAYKLMARAILDLKKYVDLPTGILLLLLKVVS